jgi:glutaredoxin
MGKVIGIIFVVAAILGGVYFFRVSGDEKSMSSEDSASDTATGIVYYYGEECPHCHDVMKFLDENKIAEKVSFEKKEVWHDKANASEMDAKVKVCGLEKNKVGVPFLFADGKCFIGTPDVTGFFKKATGI